MAKSIRVKSLPGGRVLAESPAMPPREYQIGPQIMIDGTDYDLILSNENPRRALGSLRAISFGCMIPIQSQMKSHFQKSKGACFTMENGRWLDSLLSCPERRGQGWTEDQQEVEYEKESLGYMVGRFGLQRT